MEKKKINKHDILFGLPHRHAHPHYTWSKAFYESRNKMCFLVAANQIGKALEDNTPILTTRGFKSMGDLSIGDYVYGRDGRPTKIIGIPFKGFDECYKFIFDSGEEIVSSQNHDWVCKTYKERFRKKYVTNRGKNTGEIFSNEEYGEWKIKSTQNILNIDGLNPRTANRISIPIAGPLDGKDIDLPVDPYLMGLLLGDGGISGWSVIFTSADKEIVDYVYSKWPNTIPTGKYGYRLKGFWEKIKPLGLMGAKSNSKFIPDIYFYGSINQRLELLKGLLDTDGYISAKSNIEFTTVSPQLRDGVKRLILGLGGKCKITKSESSYKKDGKKIKCQDSYELRIKTLLNPFKLKRKAEKFYKTRYKHERVLYEIIPMGRMACTCITVDNSDGTFLAGEDLIVTHNSSSQIRKIIEWAGNPELWPSLWKTPPRQFWYLYPSKQVATAEFKHKWLTEWLPRGHFKDHPTFGWTHVMDDKQIESITFNSGVTIYFKTYSQDVMKLQSGTVHYIATDEELPMSMFDELMFRLAASSGYFSMVFTATIGQDILYRTMERVGNEDEMFPGAFKLQVSMRDCTYYDNGQPSQWTEEKIKEIESKCKNQAEIDKRVNGRFVQDSNRTYSGFSRIDNVVTQHAIPHNWNVYSGVDIGGGGESHPSAIIFVAVSPKYDDAVVFRGWRGEPGIDTTAGDTLEKYISLRGNLKPVAQYYDWGSKDFYTLAVRAGESFQRAEKAHALGEDTLNSIFKYKILKIFNTEELRPLVEELMFFVKKADKSKQKDDFIDALRYCVSQIPWDVSKFIAAPVEKEIEHPVDKPGDERRRFWTEGKAKKDELEIEIDMWNDLYE